MQNKTLDLTPMKWVQEKHARYAAKNNAKLYCAKIAKQRKRKRNDKIITAALATLCIAGYGWMIWDGFNMGNVMKSVTVKETEVVVETTTEIAAEEQPYIVRYGYVDGYNADGEMIIITEDVNEWNVIDPPGYAEETELYVLFDSNGTFAAEDDEIIDISER